ncbi:MAG: IS3 family transposase [Egibacteraceae bacterium]
MRRYRCVDDQKAAGFPVAAACDAAGVSRAAYYAWAAQAAQGASQREQDEADLVAAIRRIHADSNGTYGSPRVTEQLARDGRKTNHKRVERLMRAHDVVGHRPRRPRSLTKQDEKAPPAPDLVGRLFDPDHIDVIWCGDITYVPTDEGWLYLATTLDLASRRLLGWSMDDHMRAELVTSALEAAVAFRGRTRMNDTIFHSDRGSQYTSNDFAETCDKLGIRRSMGRTGTCLDNAVAESFFATLKVELCDRTRYATREEARAAIFRWIAYYNNHRLHSTLGYLAPAEWELQHCEDQIGSDLAA